MIFNTFSLKSRFIFLSSVENDEKIYFKLVFWTIFGGDPDGAIKFLYFPQDSQKNGDKEFVSGKIKSIIVEQSRISEDHGEIKSIKTIDKNINKNSARIKIQVEFKDGKTTSESFKLIKSNGGWKVNMFKS